jgi:penicillin-binding protein 1C
MRYIKGKFLFLVLITFSIIQFFLPKIQFNKPYSYSLYSSNGELLDYQVAKDGQWRIKLDYKQIPYKYLYCLLYFEDKRFFIHNGIDILAFIRAMYQNIKYGKFFSGGSTITMQVARLYFGNNKRTIFQKIKEILLAIYLELTYSKNEILMLYMQNAPFGGNIVGVETAAYKYFNRSLVNLSWSESALLAVLPKNPSNINFFKNTKLLKKRRDYVLKKLYNNKIIDYNTYLLSIEDEIQTFETNKNHLAPHLLEFLKKKFPEQYTYNTYIDYSLQNNVYDILLKYRPENKANQIYNIAVVVCRLPSKEVICYIGNFHDQGTITEAYNVNMIEASRSGGSILKPLLYATMLDNGELLPDILLPDIPIQIGGYSPKNFNLSYDGAVKAKDALARSLNIPAVKMLQSYGIQRFIDFLKKMGFTTINKSQDYYGLSLILGGCEIKMSDLLNSYSNMAISLLNKTPTESLKYLKEQNQKQITIPLSKGAIWLTFQAMNDVERPDNQSFWYLFQNKKIIAWKTGTSFGYRDAWAIGITPEYAVAVWVGNATGKSNPELIAIKKAAPILFDIFSILPIHKNGFDIPYQDLQLVETCKESGYLPSQYCNSIYKTITCKVPIKIKSCPYHKVYFVDSTGKFRINNNCELSVNIHKKTFFALPPLMEYYYKKHNLTYEMLPPIRDDCKNYETTSNIEIVYPQVFTNIYIPRNLDGSSSSVLFEATHRKKDAVIYWFVDNNYLGQTQYKHIFSININVGEHCLTLQDEFGETKTIKFKVVYSSNK